MLRDGLEAFQTSISLTNVQDSAPWMLLKLQFKHSRQRTRACLATWFKQQLHSNVTEQLSVKSWDGIEVSGGFFACPWISLPCHFLANRKPLKDLLHTACKAVRRVQARGGHGGLRKELDLGGSICHMPLGSCWNSWFCTLHFFCAWL